VSEWRTFAEFLLAVHPRQRETPLTRRTSPGTRPRHRVDGIGCGGVEIDQRQWHTGAMNEQFLSESSWFGVLIRRRGAICLAE
jgi:hypothetical protein